MKISSKLIITSICSILLVCACKKDRQPQNIDLKTKTLPELKAFLNGTWKLEYSLLSGVAGSIKYDGNNSLVIFYPTDSIKWVDKAITDYYVRDKAVYTRIKSWLGGEDSVYKISFYDKSLGYKYNWIADRVVNDTLVFADSRGTYSEFHLTRK